MSSQAMKHIQWGMIAFPTVLLAPCLNVAPSSASAATISLGQAMAGGLPERRPEVDLPPGWPVLRALDPEEAARQTPIPDKMDRPVVRDHEAVLPNPTNGRELVDGVLAQERREGLIAPPTTTAAMPQRVFQRTRAASNFLLPTARGM